MCLYRNYAQAAEAVGMVKTKRKGSWNWQYQDISPQRRRSVVYQASCEAQYLWPDQNLSRAIVAYRHTSEVRTHWSKRLFRLRQGGDVVSKTIAMATHYLKVPTDLMVEQILGSCYASLFYFELDSLPVYVEGLFTCSGSIRCRLDPDSTGTAAFNRWWMFQRATFLVNGIPMGTEDDGCVSRGSLRCDVKIGVSSLDDHLSVTVKIATDECRLISGSPASANMLILAQGLAAPFGRIYGTSRAGP